MVIIADSEGYWTVSKGFRNECPNSAGIGVLLVLEWLYT